MKKQELVHLHELLAVVLCEYEQRTGRAVTCREYEYLQVQPTSVYQPKSDHQEAIATLAGELTASMAKR